MVLQKGIKFALLAGTTPCSRKKLKRGPHSSPGMRLVLLRETVLIFFQLLAASSIHIAALQGERVRYVSASLTGYHSKAYCFFAEGVEHGSKLS